MVLKGKQETIEGIITRSQNYGEKDRLVTLFTPTDGLITGIVKGVGRKKMGSTDTGAQVEYVITRTKSALFTTRTVSVKHAFLGIRRSMVHIKTALSILQLITETQHESHPSPELYALLTAYLSAFDTFDAPHVLLESFTLKLHRFDGLLPETLTPREHTLAFATNFNELKHLGFESNQ